MHLSTKLCVLKDLTQVCPYASLPLRGIYTTFSKKLYAARKSLAKLNERQELKKALIYEAKYQG